MTETYAWKESACYLFDEVSAADRITQIRQLLGAPVKIAYAVKANPFLIGGLIGVADRFEICSPGEQAICEELGVSLADSVISGVYKTPSEMERTVQNFGGQIYTIESLQQFALLSALAEKNNQRLPVLLRLTNGSQFGLDESDILALVTNRKEHPNMDFRGIQFFSGTQKTSLKKLQREIAELETLLQKLDELYGWKPEELEYGPGFPAACFLGEESPDALISAFGASITELSRRYTITLELGRSIAACAGRYYTHVVDLKSCKGQRYALTDGGMHQIVYYGQFMGMKHPAMSVVGKEEQENAGNWNICGALCSMNDVMVKQVPLPLLSIGDTICFENAGAYCVTEGSALFLSRELPAVFIKKRDGSVILARPAIQTYPFNTV